MLAGVWRSSSKLKRPSTLTDYYGVRPASKSAAPRPPELPALVDLGQGCWVRHEPAAWSAAEAATLTQRLLEEVSWDQKEIMILGKRVLQPRLVAYEADAPELYYTYSRQQLRPETWHPVVAEIKVCRV